MFPLTPVPVLACEQVEAIRQYVASRTFFSLSEIVFIEVFVIVLRARRISHRNFRDPAVLVGHSIFRVESDSLFEVCYRFVIFPLVPVGNPTVTVSRSNARVKPDGVAEVCNRLVIFALAKLNKPTVIESRSIFRVKPDGLGIIRYCFAPVLLARIGPTTLAVCLGAFRSYSPLPRWARPRQW